MNHSIKQPCFHVSTNISHVCLIPTCEERFLCNQCHLSHNNLHSNSIKPMKEVLSFDSKSELTKIKDLLANPTDYQEKMNQHYVTTLNKIKKDIEDLIELKKSSLSNKNFPQIAKGATILDPVASELQNLQAQYSQSEIACSDHGISILASYIEKYIDFFEKGNSMKKAAGLYSIKSLSYKELENEVNALLKSVDQAFTTFEKAYFGETLPPQIKEIVEKKPLGFTPAPLTLPKLDFESLKSELTVKLAGTPGWDAIEYVPEQKVVIIGDNDGNLEAWEAPAFNCVLVEKYHQSAVNKVKYYKKGKILLTASNDRTIKALKIQPDGTPTLVKTLIGHKDKVSNLLVLEDYHSFYSSGEEKCIIGWDLNTLTVKHKIETPGKDNTRTEMVYIPKLKALALSFKRGYVNMYNVENSGELASIKLDESWFYSLTYIESKDYLVAGTSAKTLKVWEVGNMKLKMIKEHKIPGDLANGIVTVNSDNDLLIASQGDQLMKMELSTGECKVFEEFKLKNIGKIKLIPQLRKVLIASNYTDITVAKY